MYQAGKGQWALISHARPIPDVIQDERTPTRIKTLLKEIQPVKKFGEENGLKPTSNYTEYVKLDRNAAVWVISACDPLKFKAKEWSFPLVGSFPYLGWFDRKDAEEYADELKREGLDVDLRGAGAYSTLGWFRDSVLSTMIPKGEEALGDLINVILHESVHATVYIPGQSYFNESLASFIADHLTPIYLEKTRGHESPELKTYLEAEVRNSNAQKVLHGAYLKLDGLYNSPVPDAEKLEQKQQILAKLKVELGHKRDINNATLIQYKTYFSGNEAFEELYRRCGNWRSFLNAISNLKAKTFEKPQQTELDRLLAGLRC